MYESDDGLCILLLLVTGFGAPTGGNQTGRPGRNPLDLAG